MKKIVPIIIIVVLLIGGWMVMRRSGSLENDIESGGIKRNDSSVIDETNAKVFTVVGNNYAYDLKEIKVNKGDVVKINFKNSEGFHDFVIDELGVNSGKIEAGKDTSIVFIADKVGSFQYYCSVGQHRANGMWGNLIVTE